MACEYSANAVQTVAAGAGVIFTASPRPCRRGLIYHRDESALFRLASPSKIGCNCRPCCCCGAPEATYQVAFHANINVPEGGTVEPISLAIAIDGEIDPSSIMTFTPAAAGELGNVGADVVVGVPCICGCSGVSVRNVSGIAIEVQNANFVIDYTGVSR